MDEIVLDRKTFEALAIDTRINILKALKQRRKTQSELSKELSLAVSTISEHLEKLENANLIKRENQGKKWVYFALTKKGQQILQPKAVGTFVFALSLSIIIMVIGAVTIYTPVLVPINEMVISGNDVPSNNSVAAEMLSASGVTIQNMKGIDVVAENYDSATVGSPAIVDSPQEWASQYASVPDNASDNLDDVTFGDINSSKFIAEMQINQWSVRAIVVGFILLVCSVIMWRRKNETNHK